MSVNETMSISSDRPPTGASSLSSRTEVEFAVRKNDILLHCSKFGLYHDLKRNETSVVKQFKWINKNNMEVQAITYGATITKIMVSDKHGQLEDVVLGFDTLQGYEGANNPNIGCTIGRVANRIAHGEFQLGETKVKLEKNSNGHHLHGGSAGFDKRNWVATNDGTKVYMSLVSEDGDGGYPGDVLTTVIYYLDNENVFHIEMQATTSKETPLNLTNHSYFNLGGHHSGFESLYDHVMTINADKITVNDCEAIPTGKFKCVGGSIFDFRVPRHLGEALARVECNGFDNNFCITKGTEQKLTFMARALHPKSGRYLEIYSDQPGLQFYTANFLPNPDLKINPMERYESQSSHYSYKTENVTHLEPVSVDMSNSSEEDLLCECPSDFNIEPVMGKGGALYKKHGAFCLEPQKYPDSVNRPEFPIVIVKPGEIYSHTILFKFGVKK